VEHAPGFSGARTRLQPGKSWEILELAAKSWGSSAGNSGILASSDGVEVLRRTAKDSEGWFPCQGRDRAGQGRHSPEIVSCSRAGQKGDGGRLRRLRRLRVPELRARPGRGRAGERTGKASERQLEQRQLSQVIFALLFILAEYSLPLSLQHCPADPAGSGPLPLSASGARKQPSWLSAATTRLSQLENALAGPAP
jgi:hypothetical protein